MTTDDDDEDKTGVPVDVTDDPVGMFALVVVLPLLLLVLLCRT